MRNTLLKYQCLFPLVLAILFVSCEDFLATDAPKTEVVTETVFSSDASAMSALRGIYSSMVSSQSFSNGGLERFTGLSADELNNHLTDPDQQQFHINQLLSVNGIVANVFWQEPYRYINNANNILAALENSSKLSPEMRTQLEGEARFIRAFCHFYLVNLFGDVPYVTSPDYRINANAERNSVDDVYASIIEDLTYAEPLLVEDFSFSNENRNQPNRGAAQAMLARVYLYTGNWDKAEQYATLVIGNSDYVLEDLSTVFLSSSREAIWQLEPVAPEKSTAQARTFIISGDPAISGGGGVSLSNQLLESFESGDQRRDEWVGSYTETETWHFPFKYKVYADAMVTESTSVLRLAEQYLIRAEARVRRNHLDGAIEDLDIIRSRAGLLLLSDTNPDASAEELLLAVEHERKVELFAEWGHRWLDLKRTGRMPNVLGAVKPNWQDADTLYPIPLSEIMVNPALKQNPGY